MSAVMACAKPRAASASFRVEVSGKPGFPDATGTALLKQIQTLGIQAAAEARVGTLYEITGPFSLSQIQAAAHFLLSDPITQESHCNGQRPPSAAASPGSCWRIEVWLKPSVTDPVEDSVRKALADLGLPTPDSVRSGTVYRLVGRLNESQAAKIAHRLLVHPVIHCVSIAPG